MTESAPLPDRPPELPGWLSSFEQSQAMITEVLLQLAALDDPQGDVQPAADQLGATLGAIFAAFDLRGDRLSQLREALGALGRGQQLLGNIGAESEVSDIQQRLGSARELLMAAERHFSNLPGALPPEPRPFRASVDYLSLHSLPRASLLPRVRMPAAPPPPPLELPPLDKPKTVAELQDTVVKMRERQELRRAARDKNKEPPAPALPPAVPAVGPAAVPSVPAAVPSVALAAGPAAASQQPLPEGFVPPIEPALDDSGFARRRTRDMFEEIAMVGSQRAPQLGDDWRNIRFLEKRMYAAIDAVAALGEPALAAVEELVVDSPVKDPTRGFAAIMLLGSFEGRDALAAAERVVQYLGSEDDEVMAYAAQALKLVPHPHVALAMRRLLGSSRSSERAMALDVLAHRGLVSLEELARYAQDAAPEVASVALVALGLHAPYHNQLGQLLVSAAARPGTQPAAWLGMALSAHPNAKYEPANALSGPNADRAALALALVADNFVAESLIERCRDEPSSGLVTAIGWAGAAGEALPLLIDLLTHEDEPIMVAAAYALDRLTNAQLMEEVEVDPEQVIVPDVPVPEVAELESQDAPLARQVSDPRDLPSEGSPDTVLRPSTSPDAWRGYYKEQHSRYQLGARYRHGHPYSPKVSLWGLDSFPLSAAERRFLQHELVVRSGFFVRFDPLDFVHVQQQALKDWEAVLEKVQSTAGAWSRPSRRR